jgi:large-conductance mechanosensitive channel
MWRKFKENIYAVVDLNIVIMIGIVFAALMVIAYINFTLEGSLIPDYPNGSDAANAAWNTTYADMANSTGNITTGFDSAINLILVAITIFILALAIAALLMLRGRRR